MSFLQKLKEKVENADLYELSGDEDDRLRKGYGSVSHLKITSFQ